MNTAFVKFIRSIDAVQLPEETHENAHRQIGKFIRYVTSDERTNDEYYTTERIQSYLHVIVSELSRGCEEVSGRQINIDFVDLRRPLVENWWQLTRYIEHYVRSKYENTATLDVEEFFRREEQDAKEVRARLNKVSKQRLDDMAAASSHYPELFRRVTGWNDELAIDRLGQGLLMLAQATEAKADNARLIAIIAELRATIEELRRDKETLLQQLSLKGVNSSGFKTSYVAKMADMAAVGTVTIATTLLLFVAPNVSNFVSLALGNEAAYEVQQCLEVHNVFAQSVVES